MKQIKTTPQADLVISLLIFGTIGIFRTFIPLGSGMVSLVRGVIGTLFLLFFMAITRKKADKTALKQNLPLLLTSGVFIGGNWILLFESYKYAGVATATLCYYMAPVILMLISPLLGERYSPKKIISCAVAVFGMVLVTGIYRTDFQFNEQFKGIVFGLGAAVLYAAIVFMNKKMTPIEPFTKTTVQLGSATVAMLPYILLTGEYKGITLNTTTVLLLVCLGLVHTGFAYSLYFSAINRVKAQTTAILSYIDPASAVLLSALFLKENLGIVGFAGAVLIIGSAVISSIEKQTGSC